MKRILQNSVLLVFLVCTINTISGQTSNFFYGFENAPGANDWTIDIRVPSGTGGIVSANGSFHGASPLGGSSPFNITRFGGYNSVFPTCGYKTALKVYLDMGAGWANDTRVDYSCAINNPGGTHRRDFVFNIGFYNDAGAPGAGNRFVISASTNSGRANSFPKNPGRTPVAVTTTGWYTFEHSFRKNGAVLAVDLKLYDPGNTVVGSWTISDPTDIIGTTVGGNRYGWVLNNEFSPLAIDDVTLTVAPTPVHNLNTGLNYCTIQSAISDPLTLAGHTIEVDPGIYTENVTITKDNIILRSSGGKASTTIQGITAANAGAVMVASGVNGVTIGQPGKGFTIIGFDGDGAGESAALYLLGSHNNITIEDNEIRADGDHGLLSVYNAAIDGITIKRNMFTGKTFLGSAPGDCGFDNQFVLGNNIPRQLVTMGGGAGVTNSRNVYFINNTITGTAGGFNAVGSCITNGQGNTLVTIDVIGSTISGNTFSGVTTRFSSSLRARGPGASIFCNTFYSGGLHTTVSHIFLGSSAPLGSGASPSSLAGIASSNSFPDGGAYLTPDYFVSQSINSYSIYRDMAQATAAATALAQGQTANPASVSVNCPVTNLNTGMTFQTIQSAINHPLTQNGHTIQAAAGTYSENVILNKSLVIKGAQSGVDACGRSATESVITGAGDLITLVTGAAGSVIDGFTFSGGSRSIVSSSGPLDNLVIQNNRFLGFTGSATFLNDQGNDITIHQNSIDGSAKTSAGAAMHFDTDPFHGLHITDNCVMNGALGAGMFVDGNRNVGTSPTPRSPLIKGNLFQNFLTNVGINSGSRSLENAVIVENTFDGNAADGFQGGPKNSFIERNTFSNNGRWGLALTSFGNLTAGRGAQGTSVKNNFFFGNNGVAGGDLLLSNQPTGAHGSNTITENSFLSTRAIVNNEPDGVTDPVSATCNWFGTAISGGVTAKITNTGGAVTIYAPWLLNGTDNDAVTPGFQPVPGSCVGSNDLTITCPAPVTVQCAGDVPAANTASVTATGTCTGIVVTHVDDVISNQTCANKYTITRTYQATDDCGNNVTCTQIITVNDNTAPVLTVPGDVTVECTSIPAPGGATATDNCLGTPTVGLWNPDQSTPSPIHTAYTGARVNGNQNYQDRLGMEFNASVPVVITALGAYDDGQNGLMLPITVGIVRENDGVTVAGPITMSGTSDPLDGYFRMRNIAPVLLPAGNYIIVAVGYGNAEQNGNSNNGGLSAVFNGGGVLTSVSSPYGGAGFGKPTVPFPTPSIYHAGTFKFYANLAPSCPVLSYITRTYSATDECGNTTIKSQSIRVEDNTAPVLTVPGDVTLECTDPLPKMPLHVNSSPNSLPGTYNFSSALFGPALTSTPITGDAELVNDGTPNTADACQPIINSVAGKIAVVYRGTCTFVSKALEAQNAGAIALIVINNIPGDNIQVMGGTNPAITIPSIMVSANYGSALTTAMGLGTVNLSLTASPVTVSECSNLYTISHTQTITPGGCEGSYSILNTWTATDGCGNATSNSQTISVQDSQAPVFTVPGDVTQECSDPMPLAPVKVNSSPNNLPGGYNVASATFGPVLTTTPLTADAVLVNDGSGNTADACEPILNMLAGKIAVIDRGTCNFIDKAFAAQNLGAVAVIIVNNVPGNAVANMGAPVGPNPTITIPVIMVSSDYGTALKASMAMGTVNLSLANTVSVSDCSSYRYLQTQVITPGLCPGSYSILNTWTVIDFCGNGDSKSQTITVQDTQAPTINGCPGNIVVTNNTGSCNYTVSGSGFNPVSATDNCGTPTLTYTLSGATTGSGSNTLNGVVFNLGVTTVVWTASDGCNISANCSFTVTVNQNSSTVVVYTILADEEVHLHKNAVNGNIGVWKAGKDAKIHDETTVSGFVKAPVIDLTGGSTICGAQILAQAPAPAAAYFRYNAMPDPPGDINVPDNFVGIFNLVGTSFKKITIGKNSTARFTSSGDIYIKELITKDADNGKVTELLFSGNTELMIRKKLEVGKRSSINTGGTHTVKAYVEEDDVKVKESSKVWASIDARFKTLDVEDGKETNHTVFYGQYIAKKVDSKKWVDWNGLCVAPVACAPIGGLITHSNTRIPATVPGPGEFSVKVYPNPSTTDFRIQVQSSSTEPVTIRLIDVSGRTIQQLTNGYSNEYIRVGGELRSGSYFAEVRQGANRQTVKLLKME